MGGSARACHMEERKRDRESEGPRAQRSTAWGKGHGRQQPPAIGRGRRHCGANRGERRGMGDAALRD
jgi:hypothetical protein